MQADTTLTLLQRVFALMNTPTISHAVFAGITDLVMGALDAEVAAIFEYHHTREALSLATARNLSLRAQMQIMRAVGQRADSAKTFFMSPQIITNWRTWFDIEGDALADDIAAMHSMLTVPLRTSKGELLGVILVFSRHATDAAERQQMVASLLGGIATIALENAQLHETNRHQTNFLAQAMRLSEQLQADQSLDSILKRLAQGINTILGWQTVVILLLDFRAGVRYPAAWVTPEAGFDAYLDTITPIELDIETLWKRAELRISQSYYCDSAIPMGRYVLEQLQLAFPSFFEQQASAYPNPLVNQWHPNDFMATPLMYNNVELGWVVVSNPRDNRRPNLVRVQELEVLADQAAHAIVNARMYAEAEQERLKLTTVLDGIRDGVLAFDNDMRVLFFNRASERLLGVQFSHTEYSSLPHVLAGHPLLHFLQGIVSSGEIEQANKRTLFVDVTPLAQEGRVVLMRDVTYLREMERLRLELLGSLSHDLKNPLAAIDMMTKLIEVSGELNPKQKNQVERLRQISQRAVGMVGDLLDMARLESGGLLSLKTVNLTAMIEEIVIALEVLAHDKAIELQCELEPMLCVQADGVRLRQAIENLISNAIKYTPEGGTIRVRSALVGDGVVTTIQDTGIGIPADHLPYIFDRFYRVNPDSPTQGTGLGLAIVKSVIEMHSGEIEATSTLGEGSTFTFRLLVEP